MPNFVPIGQTVVEIWPIFDFSRWRPSIILDFEKFEILPARPIQRPNLRHDAKFHADQSNRCTDMADF